MVTEDLELLEGEDPGQEDSVQGHEEDADDVIPDDPLEDRTDLQKALYTLYVKACQDDRFPHMMKVRDIQQAYNYWRGLQYWWWSQRDESWNLPNQQHGLQIVPENVDDMPRFEFVTNIYQSFGLSWIAAVAQAPPRTRWFPEDADDPDDVATAEGYSKLSKIIERWNPIQTMLQDEGFEMYTGGVLVGWTRYVADGDKYGTEEIEDLEQKETPGADEVRCANCGWSGNPEDMEAEGDETGGSAEVPDTPEKLGSCPRCGATLTDEDIAPGESTIAPASAGKSDVPKGRQIITIKGGLNIRCPEYANDQAEMHYLGIEEEIHYCKVRAAHPDIAEKIKPGAIIGDDNGYARNARLQVMQGTHLQMQTGEAQSVLGTYARVWFRPEAFWMEGIDKQERADLLDIFPRGCRVTFYGDVYCESEEECMDDCLVITHSMPGKGQHRAAVGSSGISVQDRFNTLSNISMETYEYGLPITYRAADTWDAQANEEQQSEPGAEVDVLVPAGTDIRTRIMQLRNDSVSPDMAKHMMDLMGPIMQELTGVFPALQGGAGEGAAGDTASGYAMQRDQALGRCGISYVRLKQFHADIQTLACKDYCAHASGRTAMSVLSDSGDFETEAVDVTALNGDARAYPEGDENYPVLWNQQRATFMTLMQNPMGQQLMASPKNAKLAVRLIGIQDIEIPGADAERFALQMIGELTEESPQGGEGSMDVRQGVQQMIGPLEDHGMCGQAGKEWLYSEVGLKCLKENPTGWHNVEAWTQAQLALVPKPPEPQKPISRSLSVAIDKLPPEVQAKILASEGIEVQPEDFIAQAALESVKKAPSPKPGVVTGGQAGPPANIPAGPGR